MVENNIILPLITFYVGIYFTQVITNVEEVYKFRISRVTRESKVRGCGIGVCVREREACREATTHVLFFIIIHLLFSIKVFYFFQEYCQPCCGGSRL